MSSSTACYCKRYVNKSYFQCRFFCSSQGRPATVLVHQLGLLCVCRVDADTIPRGPKNNKIMQTPVRKTILVVSKLFYIVLHICITIQSSNFIYISKCKNDVFNVRNLLKLPF